MLYVLRDTTGAVDFSRGTLVPTSGEARYLAPDEFSVRSTATWESPRTDAVYPAGWEVALPGEGLRMLVLPVMADQENRSDLMKSMFYWEGRGENHRPGRQADGAGLRGTRGVRDGQPPAAIARAD